MNILEFKELANQWGRNKIPFLFIIDFEMEKPLISPLSNIGPEILFEINGFGNANQVTPKINSLINIETCPVSFEVYQEKFAKVFEHLVYGNSFLTNLTIKTRITLNADLLDVYHVSRARYKLYYKNQFLVFSPETFVSIRNGRIFSYPMKGTIDAGIPHAHHKILSDPKELAEHITIVDLIRNDLSRVATNVEVKRFRYLEEIHTQTKNLLQVSSEISGVLPQTYHRYVGDLLISLLPAGSISGAPKEKTIEIIREAEEEKRGYYTGVFGYFDGENLDSGVMIRYIEQDKGDYFYRSGGGLTARSNARAEYRETLDKIYVPVN